MFADALRIAPGFMRSHAALLLFLVSVGIQGAALKVALQRTRPAASAPVDDCDLAVRDTAGEPAVEMTSDLPELTEPIDDAEVPSSPDRLPGAARTYRGGVHEGVDFRCPRGTPVHAAEDGTVLTVENEPVLPEAQRNTLLRQCRELGDTPPEVLRALHGRRITLNLGVRNGHLYTASYSHLDSIRADLKPGMRVHEGEVIGMSGASGTSHAYLHDGWGEVHFELRRDGQPLGLGLAPADAAQLYRDAFGECR